jgi:branched-subunit amino acid aminotransferase/4-amino-4-deoxychorismate lyase
MFWHIADHKAREQTGSPHALAISLENAAVTETSIANFLVVVNGVVVSPPSHQVLAGISRRVTMELCRSLGIEFMEMPVKIAGLSGVSEAMLTGTGFCLAGVRELHHGRGSDPIRFEWPGPVFRRLLAAWSDLVGVDIEKSFTQ